MAAGLCALLLGACGDVAFKRGAQGDDFQQASTACRQKTVGEAAYRQCLRDGGWAVLDALSLPALPAAPGAEKPAQADQTGQTASSAASGSEAQPPVAITASDLSANDSQQRIRVGSWWKFGAGSHQLQADRVYCRDQLGAQDAGSSDQEVTRGMAACMRQRGWQAMP